MSEDGTATPAHPGGYRRNGAVSLRMEPATPGITATINVRVAPSTRSVVDFAAKRLGVSVREVVERAVLEQYSAEFERAASQAATPGAAQAAYPAVDTAA